MQASVDSLDDVKNDTLLKGSVDNIITLALEGNHLCRLIAKHGGVRSLLTICVDPKKHNVRVNAFRALGTVCCVLEGIMELEDAGGVEILSDTLKDDRASEEEKSEAAGLLAQVTSPWIENNNTIEGLSRHLNDLVQSLTSKLLYDITVTKAHLLHLFNFWHVKGHTLILPLFDVNRNLVHI